MKDAGSALMGIGAATGEDRALRAVESAISSPLLEASIDGAHGVLMFFQGGSDVSLQEVFASSQLVREAVHPEANIIFGVVVDDTLGDEIRVTVIAAGFDDAAEAAPVRPAAASRVSAPVAQKRSSAPEAKAPETSRITQLPTRRPQHRLNVAAPVREAEMCIRDRFPAGGDSQGPAAQAPLAGLLHAALALSLIHISTWRLGTALAPSR